ncbi:hypothetical protein GCM10023216_14930 [Isoptericola chiayiensis]|uniref:Glycosyl transferase family 4 n=1 Tax=Isoptericola chiayiensis TaxID=579446 RepID=A0ABP8YAX5_9MICO|nr:hypothetical protein [Isoptericola chiayiensis]NOV99723.1 UDP-N-acetylmuramyl pentapeptide phosphotransferase/UDP-N-acetylglucosamine-1-phosphate transferase [Isoptericola chiayiensis]
MGLGRVLLAAGAAAAATAVSRRLLAAAPPGGATRWERTNHRGETVSMLEGPAVAVGLVGGALAASGEARSRVAVALATAGGGAFGVVDDLAEDTAVRTKGLRGHLGALARGRVTTGGLKVLGITATSLAAAAVAPPRGRAGVRRAADVLVDGALIAGTANLVNLLDLRPGRALKASLALAAPAGVAPGGGALLGAGAAAASRDLAESDMLGDGGANALGAYVGARWVVAAPRPVRLAALAAVVGLTLVSERVSFSAVIDRTPWLHRIDQVGRRPAPAPATVPPGEQGEGSAA